MFQKVYFVLFFGYYLKNGRQNFFLEKVYFL